MIEGSPRQCSSHVHSATDVLEPLGVTEIWSVVGGVYFALGIFLVPDELDDAVVVGPLINGGETAGGDAGPEEGVLVSVGPRPEYEGVDAVLDGVSGDVSFPDEPQPLEHKLNATPEEQVILLQELLETSNNGEAQYT